jgi:hypothetical protein
MAPMTSEQTAMQAMNRVRNIKVSNFMVMSPVECVVSLIVMYLQSPCQTFV